MLLLCVSVRVCACVRACLSVIAACKNQVHSSHDSVIDRGQRSNSKGIHVLWIHF